MADTLVGRSVSFNPAIGGMSNSTYSGVSSLLSKYGGDFVNELKVLNTKLSEQAESASWKGRLDQEAGLTDESRVSVFLRGAYREGAGLQRGIQDAQVLTARYGKEYEEARLSGADEQTLSDLKTKHMQSQVQVIDGLGISEENKDLLRKQVINTLPTLEKLEAKADARAVSRQYEDTKVTLAQATRNNIVAASKADPIEVHRHMQAYIDGMVQIERNHGNDDKAYEVANKNLDVYIKTLVDNVDMENPEDVQMLNGLMSVDFSRMRGVAPETLLSINTALHKGRERARDVLFQNMEWNLQERAIGMEGGKEFTVAEANSLVAQIDKMDVPPSAKVRYLQKVHGLLESQSRKNESAAMSSAFENGLSKLADSLNKDVTGMTRREAIAKGLESEWYKSRKEGIFEKFGNWSDTGNNLMMTGAKEGSPDMIKYGASTMSEFWSGIVSTNTPESYANIQGGQQFDSEFQRFRDIYKGYSNNPAMQYAILQGVPDEIRSTVADVLDSPAGAQSNLSTVIQRYNYLKQNFNPKMIEEAKARAGEVSAKDLRKSRILGMGTSKNQELIGERNAGALKAISGAVIDELKSKGLNPPLSAAAFQAEARAHGYLTETSAGFVVTNRTNRDILKRATNGAGEDTRARFLSYLMGDGDTDYYMDAVSTAGKVLIYDMDKSQSKPVQVYDQAGLAQSYQKWTAEDAQKFNYRKDFKVAYNGTYQPTLGAIKSQIDKYKAAAKAEENAAAAYRKQEASRQREQYRQTATSYTPSKSQAVAKAANQAAYKAAMSSKPAGRVSAPIIHAPEQVAYEDENGNTKFRSKTPEEKAKKPKPAAGSRQAILENELSNERSALAGIQSEIKSLTSQIEGAKKAGNVAVLNSITKRLKELGAAGADRKSNIKALQGELSR